MASSFDDRKESLINATADFEATSQERLEGITAAFEAQIELINEQVEQIISSLDATSDEAFSAAKDKYLSEVVGRLDETTARLNEVLAALMGDGQENLEKADAMLSNAMEQMEAVLRVIEGVRPVLEHTEAVLG